jgi:hypothetical protein
MSEDRQEGRTWLGYGAVATVILALLVRPGEHPSGAGHSKQSEDKKGSLLTPGLEDGPAPSGPLKPVWDHIGRAPSKDDTHKKKFAVELSTAGAVVYDEAYGKEPHRQIYDWPSCCYLEDFSFRFLIATVPDPSGSGLAHEFDQTIEVLQRAIEADDYVIDRAWIPWRTDGPPQRTGSNLGDKHPGLVLFRDDHSREERERYTNGKKRLLVLLLVGETPTAGISKSAFFQAINIIHSCTGDKKEGNRIRVVGPNFSGSAGSLSMALREVRQEMEKPDKEKPWEEPWIKVVCGSASGFDHHEFASPGPKGWCREKKGKEELPFEATILPNDILLRWVRKYLGDPTNPVEGRSPKSLLVLHEANTSFGKFALDKDEQQKDKQLQKTAKEQKDGDASDPTQTKLYKVPFPLHISQLRAMATKEQLARAENAGLPHSGRNLPFPSEGLRSEEAAGREVIPVQAPLMSAAIADLILDNLVTPMAQMQVPYSCLISTDIRDTIFLANTIRERYPDVQLVTLGGNLLLTHEDYTYALRGMIVVSTYPLYLRVQKWSDLGKDRTQVNRILFSQDGYEGCYNAALVHLMGQDGEKKVILASAMMDYGWKEDPEKKNKTMPPLWISVVGSNGQLVPVACIPPETYLNNPPPNDNSGKPPKKADPFKYIYRRDRDPNAFSSKDSPPEGYGRLSPPNVWSLGFVVLLSLNIWFFYRAWRFLKESSWKAPTPDWQSVNAARAARYKQRIDFAVGCLAQILFYGEAERLACIFLCADQGQHTDWHATVLVSMVLFISLAMVLVSWGALVAAHRLEHKKLDISKRYHDYREMCLHSAGMFGWYPLKSRVPWMYRGGSYIVLVDIVMFVLGTGTLVCFIVRWLFIVIGGVRVKDVLDFERIVHIGNGVSPLLPRACFCAALIIWSYFLVKKLHLANRYSIECPFPGECSPAFTRLRELHDDVRSELMPPSTLQKHFWICLLLLGSLTLGLVRFAHQEPAPVDGWMFGYLSLFGFFAGAFLLLFTLLQLYFSWHSLRRLLRFLTLLPMQAAFERLPDKVVAVFGHYLFTMRPRHSHLRLSVQKFYEVRRLFPAFHAKLRDVAQKKLPLGPMEPRAVERAYEEVYAVSRDGKFIPPINLDFDRELNPLKEEDLTPPAESPVEEWGGATGKDVHDLSSRCLRVLAHFWPAHTLDEAFGKTKLPGGAAEHSAELPAFGALPKDEGIREWLVVAEEFVAMEIIRYISQFIVQLRNLLVCLTVGSLLLLLAATVYPFFPQNKLLLFLTLLAGGIAMFILVFLIQINQDELVSRITRSTPNRFTPDLSFLHGATAYILPIVAGVMVQFPLVTSTLRSMLDPLFHIIK